MKRAFLFTPLLLATALSAQVPTPPTPRTAPVPAPAPRVLSVPTYTVSPWVDVNPDFNLNFDTNFNYDFTPLADWSYAFDNINSRINDLLPISAMSGWGQAGPVAWAQSDPADSLYRQARDQFNRGDYRKAAALFKSLPVKFSNSVYVADAQYYQAFSLYRIGGTPELQEALGVLEARTPTTPERGKAVTPAPSQNGGRISVVYNNSLAGMRGRNNDAAGLAARIANVLSSRGLANDPAVKRALAAGGNSCDQEDQSVKAEALSALMQNNAEMGRQMAVKILASKDECSVPLRQGAVMLVGNKHDDAAATTLIPVAKSDPSPGVRMEAMDYLIRIQTDAAVNAVIDLARANEDKEVQRAAVRALAQSTNARARAEVRTIVENGAADEALRVSVIDGMDRDRMTAEDAAWLRSLYAKATTARIKARIVSAVAHAGGDANNQWLMALVRNDDESLESRSMALERVGRTMDLPTLTKIYDGSSQAPIRRAVIELLSERKEPEALDKIVDVARHGTDPAMRRQAIYVLSRSKDPRAAKLLLELVDH